jgi:hypothetical protein
MRPAHDKVEQGADLQVARVATQTSGTMHFKWQLSGEIERIDFEPTTIDKDNVTCEPKLSGGGSSARRIRRAHVRRQRSTTAS